MKNHNKHAHITHTNEHTQTHTNKYIYTHIYREREIYRKKERIPTYVYLRERERESTKHNIPSVSFII